MRRLLRSRTGPPSNATPQYLAGPTPFIHTIGRTRLIVLVAVAAVLLVAAVLFLLGTWFALEAIWEAFWGVARGEQDATDLTVRFLEIVSVMFKAVVFYLIGVGLYSLFVAPLNVTAALGVETFNDLEIKVVSVIIVISGVTFLQHFIQWTQPSEILLFAIALAVVVAALVFFQIHSEHAKEEQWHRDRTLRRAQRELFQEAHEERDIAAEEVQTSGRGARNSGRGRGPRDFLRPFIGTSGRC